MDVLHILVLALFLHAWTHYQMEYSSCYFNKIIHKFSLQGSKCQRLSCPAEKYGYVILVWLNLFDSFYFRNSYLVNISKLFKCRMEFHFIANLVCRTPTLRLCKNVTFGKRRCILLSFSTVQRLIIMNKHLN